MRRVLLISLTVVLLSAPASQAQWAVHDAPAAVQRGILWAEEALQWAQSLHNQVLAYQRQYEQLVNEFRIISNQISQYETMVRNLQRLPEGLNVMSAVQAYGNALTALLSQTNAVSYELGSATRQFGELYGDGRALAAGDFTEVRQRFLAARMQASAVAVQVQSIQGNTVSIFQRLCALLDGSWTAQGNLDSHQLAAQQQALQTTTLQHMQALQATANRLEAQRQAEEVAMERLRIQVMDQLMVPVPEYTATGGFLPTWGWTDAR